MNRHLLASWARLHRRAIKPARSAGTVMLLVVGVLLLVLIVGMTYMHVVQEDRRAGLTVDIDAIVLAQADLAASKLLEDLAIGTGTKNGQHFADMHTNGTTNGTPDGKPDQEPYDYPGPLDKWLAATAPEGAGTSWTQVSMLGDGFWNGTNSSDTAQTLTATDAGTAKASNNPADADGDGIIDSKPEQATVFSRGGMLFFSWTRVQDSSSLANLDVWHSQVSSTGAYSATTNAPRWWYPGELDLGGLAYSLRTVHTNYSGAMTDLANVLNQRGVGSTLPTPWGLSAATQRGHSYFFGSKRFGVPLAPHKSLHLDSSNAFDPTNELELRHRNGLVYLDTEADVESTGWFRNLLRGGVTSAESKWNDSIPGVTSVANFFTNEPRHQFTTYSGASIYRMPLGGDTSTPFYGKRDLNAILAAANPAATLSTEISRVYSVGTPPLPPSVSTVAELADQLAVNIVDYADTDNILTVHNGRYGMEALPFIAEAYYQMAYNIISHNNDGPPVWTGCALQAQQVAYAIEFRNPFRKAISLANIRLVVDGTVWGTLDGLSGQATLNPDVPLILYRNSASDPNGDMTALIDSSESPISVAITNAWPTTTGGFLDIVIQMQVLDSNGSWVTYQNMTHKKSNAAYAGPKVTTSASDPIGTSYDRQVWLIGNGNGLNAITVRDSDFSLSVNTFDYQTHTTATDRLGVKNKGAQADRVSSTGHQFVFSDLGTFTHVGELLHVPIIGPTSTTTVPDEWNAATNSANFSIQPSNTAMVTTNDDYQVAHAVLLMDRLSTISPREDLVDNDGDGTNDNASELFIPGTLNLNTAPEFLMDRVLPIGSAGVRQAYIDAIIAYRDTPSTTNRTAGNYRNGRKGLAYVGEVYNLSALAAASDYGRNGVDDYNGTGFGSIQGDFLSNPTTGADGIVDDPEEKSLVARWLGQTCSTRSDVYCAYILVRGYAPGNLTTPVTERRAAVLLDRSRIATADDGVRVLGIIWY